MARRGGEQDRAGDSDARERHPLLAGKAEGISDEAFRAFIHDFYALSTGMQDMRARMAQMIGIPVSSYTALLAIAHLESAGDVNVKDVAHYLKLAGSSVTIEVNRLIDYGLLNKVPDTRDRRRVRLSLTPPARALLERFTPAWRQINGALFEMLGPGEFEAFHRSILNVLRNIEPAIARARFIAESHKGTS